MDSTLEEVFVSYDQSAFQSYLQFTSFGKYFMPGGTKMFRQRVKNSNFSDFDDIFIWSLDGSMCKKL